jgi:lysophospholipase L1-like esterase
VANTGGTKATGGAANTGGSKATGGVTSTGGSKATGGATSSAGATSTYPTSAGKPTIYLAGDSTVQTYGTAQAPQQGWGQRLAEFFTADVIIVNKSIGGRSSKSFIDEGRLTEIVNVIKAGDYLFAQWGINDRYTSDATRYTNPATTFRTYLKQYIDGARSKNAIPVLVTPTPRLDYSGGTFHNDFVDYCTAILAVGAETNTPVIDLQSKGLAYYTQIGYTAVTTTICLNTNGVDVLHFQAHGAYEMARLVAQGVQPLNLPISKFVLQAMIDAG